MRLFTIWENIFVNIFFSNEKSMIVMIFMHLMFRPVERAHKMKSVTCGQTARWKISNINLDEQYISA